MLTTTEAKTLDRWQPSREQPWDMRRVVHLHRRAGFGASWAQIERDVHDGVDVSIQRLARPERGGEQEEFERLSQVICDAAVASNNIKRLEAWWLFRMLRSTDPLGERLTLMWHNHFATSYEKVRHVGMMRDQNEVLRKSARSPFADLLNAAVKNPAMLVWLDADANRKEHPNENLARELMELFTLGVDAFRMQEAAGGGASLGSTEAERRDYYTEHDVQQAARALTGWTVSNSGFRYNQSSHDAGVKTILGRRGAFSGDQLLHLLLDHPATPRRLAWRICKEFMGEGCVTERLLLAVSEHLSANGLEIGSTVEALLRSEAFWDDANIGTRVLSPAEYVIGTQRCLEILDPPASTLLLAEWSSRMGQQLFQPPNVFGWPGGRAWLTTRTMISRANFAAATCAGETHMPAHALGVTQLAERHGCATRAEQIRFYEYLLSGSDVGVEDASQIESIQNYVTALLASPRAQLG